MSTQEAIEGFSKLLIEPKEAGILPKYANCWISKDRHFIIVPYPSTFPDHYQLLPISQAAGKQFYRFITSMFGPLSEVVAYHNRHFKQELV